MDLGAITQLEDRVIYQATREIFVGEKAKFREIGPVKQYVDCNRHKGSLSVLRLMLDSVYESTSIASQRFPDLFEPSRTQTAARTQLEAEASKSEEAALEGIIQTHDNDNQEKPGLTECKSASYEAIDNSTCNEVGTSSLFPACLPFPAEHLLMEKLQKVLEFACYEYGIRTLPNIMKNHGWDCPESVELSRWAELLGREGNLEQEGKGKPLKELLHSIAAIRHTAVHRLRTNSTGLERFLADAEDLAGVLGDNIYTKAISKLRADARSTIEELTRNKQFIQLQLEKAQEDIAKQRAELDQKEQENLRHMEQEDEKYRALAGERLGRALDLMGDLKVASRSEDTVLNRMDGDEAVPVSDADSDLDHGDQFEDCSEA
ncbi:hypothetical protein IL306_001289 [Fusarium sp. DS 682]|nr:hypothetical protein IL306_001289 [Fusarium sp. DS 682]